MKELIIGSGKREYNLGGKVTVEFSPTDMDFVERAMGVMRTAEENQKAISEELKNADADQVFAIARRRDGEMRDLVNGLFGVDVCTPLFGTMNSFAISDGLPLWANVVMAVLDECYDNVPEEEKAVRYRIDKYTKKYQKKRR